MTTENGTFVVFEAPESRRRYASLLGGLGFTFLERDVGPEPLHREFRARGAGATYLVLSIGLNFLVTVSQIRTSFPDAAVVAVGEFFDMERRIHAYLAGSDNCLSAQSGPEELASILLAIRRKGAQRIASAADAGADRAGALEPTSAWILTADGWTLASTDGPQLSLRKSERLLLLAFARNHGMAVYRGEPLEGSRGERLTGRTIDVVVNRLRRRAEMQGVALPIRSVRGRGYAFVGALQIADERFDTAEVADGSGARRAAPVPASLLGSLEILAGPPQQPT